MAIVMKFGGSSVADADRVQNAARLVAARATGGEGVVVVVSAQGDFTDILMAKAGELTADPAPREVDVLLSAGEQISMALMVMALERAGVPAVSLTGWQAGICTDSVHGNAEITRLDIARVHQALEAGRVVVVAGFQGMDSRGDITTLGRGGSDTTAVALAAALKAESCLIYTDVSGVYSADPRAVRGTVRHREIAYDQMLALAARGAQVLHDRSVRLARDKGVPVTVLSSLESGEGTRLVEGCEDWGVTAVTTDRQTVAITIKLPDVGCAVGVYLALAGVGIELEMAGQMGETLTLAVAQSEERAALEALSGLAAARAVSIRPAARISVIGSVAGETGTVESMSAALLEAGIPVLASATGTLWASGMVPLDKREHALQVVHDRFFSLDENLRSAAVTGFRDAAPCD